MHATCLNSPISPCFISLPFFFNSNSGGGVQLGSLSTVATNWPIMPTPDDYDDGEIGGIMTGRGNWSTQRKPAPVPLCPPQTPDANPGCHSGKPVTNRLSYGLYFVTLLNFVNTIHHIETRCERKPMMAPFNNKNNCLCDRTPLNFHYTVGYPASKTSSSDSDIVHYVIFRKLLDYIINTWWKPDSHTTDINEHTRHFIWKAVYSRYDVISNIFT
jgi:hypothetical protein